MNHDLYVPAADHQHPKNPGSPLDAQHLPESVLVAVPHLKLIPRIPVGPEQTHNGQREREGCYKWSRPTLGIESEDDAGQGEGLRASLLHVWRYSR
jgi:hypothetical protein